MNGQIDTTLVMRKRVHDLHCLQSDGYCFGTSSTELSYSNGWKVELLGTLSYAMAEPVLSRVFLSMAAERSAR